MNLETIQSRIQDIEQMRYTSNENEARLLSRKGRRGTDSMEMESSVSSFSFRIFLAMAILACLIFADYKQLPGSGHLLRKTAEAISYNIKLENMENIEEIWYTISDALRLTKLEGNNGEGIF